MYVKEDENQLWDIFGNIRIDKYCGKSLTFPAFYAIINKGSDENGFYSILYLLFFNRAIYSCYSHSSWNYFNYFYCSKDY